MYTLLYYQHTVKSILENRLVFRISKHDKKVCTQAQWLIKPWLIHSMKRSEVSPLPPGWGASPSQGYPHYLSWLP